MKCFVHKKAMIHIYASIAIATLVFVLVSIPISIQSYASVSGQRKVSGVSLLPADKINTGQMMTAGFHTILLNVDSIRSIKKPYNTNYKALKQLYKNIQALEKSGTDYILTFTSGPGSSADSKICTIFRNKAELAYFTQMVNEVLGRYINKPHLSGVSVNLSCPDADYKAYYEAQNHILQEIRKKHENIPFIYNLHVLTFEDSLQTLPAISMKNVTVNLPISLNALNYPGYGAAQKTSCPLDKNSLLSTLEKLDSYSSKLGLPCMITLKTPWVKNSEVMLQDIFELLKMIKLDYALCYGNSRDRFDFTTNNSVVKVIGRYNK